MKKLIDEYYGVMREIDPGFYWSDRDWWSDPQSAKVLLARDNLGFAIVGYGRKVDDDVQSEICDLYCKSPRVFRSLFRACLPHIRWPFGFQVLESNHKAQILFEQVMA